MVRIFQHASAPSFEIGGLTLGVAAFRILGTGWVHCITNRMLFSWINCLMAQSVEASNCSGCPVYHVKAGFTLLPPVYWGIKAYGKLNTGRSIFTATPS